MVRIIFLEALIVGLIARVVGYLLGLVVSQTIGPIITGMHAGVWLIDPLMALGAILLSVLLGILSSAYPAIHASKLDPTVALRSL